MRSYLFYALIISCLAACHSGGDTNQRPHDPWVFRSVLDWKPRVITLALHKDMWVAYSTENAALYKAWKGSVYFDGPVYTHAHGPQPISIGDAYQINNYEKDHHFFRCSCSYRSIQSRCNARQHAICFRSGW